MTGFFLKCSSLGTSDIQGCYSPKAKGNYILYTLIHVIESSSCRTTYKRIYVPREDSSSFWGTPPNSIGFQCKEGVFRCSAWKDHFLNAKQKNIDHLRGPFFLMFQCRNFRHTGLLLPKGNYIYSFIHVRDSIPCRTTYIEYKS